jgi:hypothetical protein
VGNDGFGHWLNIGGRSGSFEEVVRCSEIQDGPIVNGVDVHADCFKKDGGCKCIVVGGDQM